MPVLLRLTNWTAAQTASHSFQRRKSRIKRQNSTMPQVVQTSAGMNDVLTALPHAIIAGLFTATAGAARSDGQEVLGSQRPPELNDSPDFDTHQTSRYPTGEAILARRKGQKSCQRLTKDTSYTGETGATLRVSMSVDGVKRPQLEDGTIYDHLFAYFPSVKNV